MRVPAVLTGSAQDLNTGREQRAVSEVHLAKNAVGADADTNSNGRLGVREVRTDSDVAAPPTSLKSQGVEGNTKITAQNPWRKRQTLRTKDEPSVKTAEPRQTGSGKHQQKGSSLCSPFDQTPDAVHGFATQTSNLAHLPDAAPHQPSGLAA